MKALLILIFASLLFAQDNSLSIQGVLRQPSGKAVADGNYSITFSFYTVEVGGSPIANGIKIQNVEIKDGLYNANVDISGIPFNAQYYIGIKVGSDPELAPRAKLTAAPYALSLRGLTNIFPSTGTVTVGDTLVALGPINSFGSITTLGLFQAVGGLSTNGITNNTTLTQKDRIYMQNSGVIQRGGTSGSVGTSDMGLYSLVPGNHMKFVTDNAPVQWYSDGGTTPAGGTPKMTLDSSGNLDISGQLNVNRMKTHKMSKSIDRFIAGNVDVDETNGNILSYTSSAGFTVTHHSGGRYRIAFTGGSIATANYVITATVAGHSQNWITVQEKTTTYFDIYMTNTTVSLHQDFSFIVIAYN
jgi:hypothetical protein